MGLLVTLIVGAIIGWLASMLMKTNAQMGAIANIAVGVVGAWLGSWLAAMTGLLPVTTLGSIIASIVGACLLIAILKAVGVLK